MEVRELLCPKQVGLPKKKDDTWVFPNIRAPKWMVKIRENPIKMDDLGGLPPLFLETHTWHGSSKDDVGMRLTQDWSLACGLQS